MMEGRGGSLPIPEIFPSPELFEASMLSLPVIIPEREIGVPGGAQAEHVALKRVLQISHHELAPTTSTTTTIFTNESRPTIKITNYYEITRRIRSTNYGEVLHSVQLYQSSNGDFRRAVMNNVYVQKAIKVSSLSRIEESLGTSNENPLREIAALQFLGPHDYVMTHNECAVDPEDRLLYCVMEFYDGSELYELVEDSEDGIPVHIAREYFIQIVKGLLHIHTHGIAHRDLSLENVIVKKDGIQAKIIDFGMSLRLPHTENNGHINTNNSGSQSYSMISPQGRVGKQHYMSPEIVSQWSPYYALSSDIWALGVILFTMISGFPPIDVAASFDGRYTLITKGARHLKQNVPDEEKNEEDLAMEADISSGLSQLVHDWQIPNMNKDLIDIIARCLREDPTERITIEQILEHPFVVNTP